MSKLEEMKQRVFDKGVRSTDFLVTGLLTDTDLYLIPDSTIYVWIQTNRIRTVDFKRWVSAKKFREASINEGADKT